MVQYLGSRSKPFKPENGIPTTDAWARFLALVADHGSYLKQPPHLKDWAILVYDAVANSDLPDFGLELEFPCMAPRN